MSGIRCISVTPEAEKIFEELKKIKPADTSFSLMLALISKEFIEQRGKKIRKLTDFGTEIPDFFSDFDLWKELIDKMSDDDFKKLQKRFTQIGILLNKRVQRCL